jgi:peptidoglycan/LPS O-acetylase OafA/YrhL
VSALFVRAPLRAVGRWSYSIYLLHYPLQLGFVLGTAFLPPFILDGLVTTQRLANGRVVQVLGVTRWQGDLAAITMLVALVSLSAIAYRLVESPPRRWMRVRLGNV